jgi:predicted transcriptional regulator
MLPLISELKSRRIVEGLTQRKLAELSDVSQSFVAKLEAGKIEPGYEKARKIFDCLEKLHSKREVLAKEVMRESISFVRPTDSVKRAIGIMQRKAVSQLPVIDSGKSIGLVSEKAILTEIGSAGKTVDISKIAVECLMEDSAPTIQENTPLSLVTQLLNYNTAVLVKKKGKILGIITKADVLENILKKRK